MNNEKIVTFKDLIVWQEAHHLVVQIYKTTKSFPKDEQYGLTNQMRRCAVSISANIAEGFSRQYYKEKIQFYSMSQGSVTELQNHLEISLDIDYLVRDSYQALLNQSVLVHKLLTGIIKKSRELLHS